MRISAVLAASVTGLALLLAACGDKQPAGEASVEATGDAIDEVAGTPGVDTSEAVVSTESDTGALTERRDPERLLQYYANAVHVGDWVGAAKAWSLDAQMTPEKLSKEFGANAHPKLAVGKGDVEGAAGSLYYEAPVVVDYGDGRAARRGTIVLRRVNDVPGASEEQLNWRIERTSTLTLE